MERRIVALEMVAADEREAYIPSDDGGFELHPEIAALLDTQQAEIAEMEGRIASARAETKEAVVRRDLHGALIQAGVSSKFHSGVASYLRQNMSFAVEPAGDDFEAMVETPFGNVSLQSAVESWLSTDDGKPYRPEVRAPGESYFASRVRSLKGAPSVH